MQTEFLEVQETGSRWVICQVGLVRESFQEHVSFELWIGNLRRWWTWVGGVVGLLKEMHKEDNARYHSSQDRCLPHPTISLSQQLCVICHHTCFNSKRAPCDLVPTRRSPVSDSPFMPHLPRTPGCAPGGRGICRKCLQALWAAMPHLSSLNLR